MHRGKWTIFKFGPGHWCAVVPHDWPDDDAAGCFDTHSEALAHVQEQILNNTPEQ